MKNADGLKLYYVQDSDRPMHVAAKSWSEALDRWREQIAAENDGEEFEDADGPLGISLVADENDYLP